MSNKDNLPVCVIVGGGSTLVQGLIEELDKLHLNVVHVDMFELKRYDHMEDPVRLCLEPERAETDLRPTLREMSKDKKNRHLSVAPPGTLRGYWLRRRPRRR